MKRLLLLGGFVAVLAGPLAPAAPAGGGYVRASFSPWGVSVRYPGAWTRKAWCWTGVNVMPIAVLTTAPRAPRCRSPKTGVGASFPPRQRLPRSGVSVFLATTAIFPDTKPGWNTRIDGQPADVSRPSYGKGHGPTVSCPAGVRGEYRSASIRWPGAASTALAVAGFICGPRLAAGETAFRRVLHSVRFKR